MCFVSTGNPSAPAAVNLSQQSLGQSFAAGGGNVSTALQKNVNDVTEQVGTNQAQKKATAKTTAATSSSTSSPSLLTGGFGFAKKTLLGT